MKDLKPSGNFAVRQAETITEEIEDLLWSKGLLGDSTPQSLTYSSFTWVCILL